MADPRGPRSSHTVLERIVLDAFDGYGALTRPQLVEATGLSRPTVTALVTALAARGELSESATPAPTGTRGRPSLSYRRTAMAAPVALVRIAHRMPTQVSLVGEDGPIAELDTRVSWLQPWDIWAPAVREALAQLESASELPARHVVLAAPFPVEDGHGAPEADPLAGRQPSASRAAARARVLPDFPDFPEWIAHDPRPAVAELLRRPVTMINDANLAALGEARRGAARDATTAVHLLIRHGAGAGVIVRGKMITGARGMAGEVGHVQIVEDGPYCMCGNRGCLVTQSFDPFKIEALTNRYGHEPSFDDLEELTADGDAVALRFFSDLGALLAKTLAATIVLLDPDVLVIDAELRHTAAPLISGLRAELARRCPPRLAEELAVVRGQLRDAIAYGALAAVNDSEAGSPSR
ncbi:ROK family transcriptional regulator [Actinospica sp. MGRD01-02]|uniref:ROK family transcriptional regulator n=1 Tax=Actinospica acidithermotolerans TaxID=2828514 RepID=A0A941EG05_9ACTN|nr:ROK family transcriptional regulator [Actinospica acidithermotolerans]MBR7826999.1 ROK family transcriptional regulator [Actinospica acidithermotolerans]